MNSMLSLIGREDELFLSDIDSNSAKLSAEVSGSSFLVIGGAGTIGQAVTTEIFKRNPQKLHVVDLSENNLVELVRDLRSSFGYIDGDFKTYALDVGSSEYDAFIKSDGKYDYVLNLSALKHVRSEEDPFTLMRMIDVNILNTNKTINQAIENGTKKYFCVSTDKAANPVNMMGASKRIMEMFLRRHASHISISTARFANVAFSDGSLLCGFKQRIEKQQPLVAPNDVKRYFLTPKESGELCLMSCILGENGDLFFPKVSAELSLITFSEIAVKYLQGLGYEAYVCKSEDEARDLVCELPSQGKWPCLFNSSNTTGEKGFEEFYTEDEIVDMQAYINLGVIKDNNEIDVKKLSYFENEINRMKSNGLWSKKELVDLFFKLIPDFEHKEVGKYLDSKM
ncbi:UDP-N-acetylglucosamine 4,6-dehydratase [uncultured Paraglaciecola sp.]|uniref:UDP-N-acetylglucosamine 4,6-dehydratase n=1 Tax=uncultured Paraglaciecola sp. TaxID=1765024 RepID=UPI00262C4CB4|nr:UDP-N-acetylglucosamine 4,6-dehydratase [uncultured Paraglaciecola sp.]